MSERVFERANDRARSSANVNGVNRLPRWLAPAAATVPVVLLAVFYVWPFATVAARGLSRSGLADTLGSALTWRIVWFTLWQAMVSTVLTVLLGLAPAYVVARYRFPGRRLLDGLLTAMFVLPTVVMGAAVMAVLPTSLDRGVVAIVVAHVVFNLAVVVRTVGATLAALPRDLEAAAATLGAPPWRTFAAVVLPRLRASIAAAAGIVFVFTFTSYGVVRLLGGPRRSTIEVEVWRQATQFGDLDAAATLALLQLLLVGTFVVLGGRHGRRAVLTVDARIGELRAVPRRGRQRRFVAAVALTTMVVVVTPLVGLVLRSLRPGDRYSFAAWTHLGRTEVRPGIALGVDPLQSLRVSIEAMALATLLAVVVGTLAAVAVTVAHRHGWLLDTGLMLPLATSAVTVGLGLVITFDSAPFDWRASWWLVPVGQALVALPLVVRTVVPPLDSIGPGPVEAAATLGAPPLRAWWTSAGPRLRRPVVVAAGLAATVSLGEFGATSVLTRSGRETVPIAIERLLGRTGGLVHAQAYVLAVILAAATVAVVMLIDLASTRR